MAGKALKVAFAASEVAPFVKTGGLADIAGALPQAVADAGCKVIVIVPLYGSIRREGLEDTGITLTVNMDNATFFGTVFRGRLGKCVEVYFIFNNDLFSRPNPYGDAGGDYADNDQRFIFFNRAVLKLLRQLKFKPDILHVHDWHLGLVPVYCKTLPKDDFLFGTKTVLSIHNLAYQGLFPAQAMRLTGLPEQLFGPEGVEMYGRLAFFKSGLIFANALVAVSPTYAKEILKPELGFGLEGILKKRKKVLFGILNGVDTAEWDPSTDRHLPATYSAKKMEGKRTCRSTLLTRFGLPNEEERPVVGMVSRLVDQKGLDMIAAAADELIGLGIYLVALGTGEARYEDFLRNLRAAHRSRVGVEIGFNDELAHLIEAGADLFLMPSRFEPCGLNQMYSLAYGTPPIVRETGGLKDSVEDWRPKDKKGTGFVFREPMPQQMLMAVRRAVETFRNKHDWSHLVRNGMKKDFSWGKSASLYLQLYRKVLL